MIHLTTGTPGAGKTLFTIREIKNFQESENKRITAEIDRLESQGKKYEGVTFRPVYYSGISGLTLPWLEIDDPEKWDDLPTGSIIVIDECQRVFRPRGSGSSVPAYIAAMETHRHKGYDIFLITQHPMLVDQNIRRLVGTHWHVVRKFGAQFSQVHKWNSTHELTKRNLADAVVIDFKYPKEVFSYYKSSELHTHKASIPKRVWFLAAAPILIIALIWYAWGRLSALKSPSKPVDDVQVSKVSVNRESSGEIKSSKSDYFESLTPRISGLYHTAPRYDEITTPTDAPFPQACLISKSFNREEGRYIDKCGCIDQQGNRYHTDNATCRQIAINGVFKDWGVQKSQMEDKKEKKRDDSRPSDPPVARDPISEIG